MPSLSSYKGLDVVEGATGAGGIALTEDFKELADRAPMKSGSNPGATDDADAGFYPGSLWFNTTTETMWVCTDATADAAVWKSFYTRDDAALTLIPEENSEAVLISGELGVGTDSPKARLHGTGSTIVGADDAAVADGDLGASQVNVWLDETSGSEKLKFKAKLSSGTVKSGEVGLDPDGDDHPQYALLAGRPGGQALNGGTADGELLILRGSSHANAGTVQVRGGLQIRTAGGAGTSGLLTSSGGSTIAWAATNLRLGFSVQVRDGLGVIDHTGGAVAGGLTFSAGISTGSLITGLRVSNSGHLHAGAWTSLAPAGLVLQQPSGVTVPLQRWLDSAGSTLVEVSANGKLTHKATACPIVTLTDGATINIDWSQSDRHKVTLGGNRTISFSNAVEGQRISIRVQQDATGNRTVTWPSGIKWVGGSAPTLSTAANVADWIDLICTGAGAYDGALAMAGVA